MAWRKYENISFSVSDDPTTIRTKHIPDISLALPLAQPVRSPVVANLGASAKVYLQGIRILAPILELFEIVARIQAPIQSYEI
jgi:hypothetical protein